MSKKRLAALTATMLIAGVSVEARQVISYQTIGSGPQVREQLADSRGDDTTDDDDCPDGVCPAKKKKKDDKSSEGKCGEGMCGG